MPLQAQHIVAIALQQAKVPGYTSQGGQLLNMILAELCETYDFAVALQTAAVQLIPANITNQTVLSVTGSGPYNLPANYLRMASDEVIYQIAQVPYVMVNIDLKEFDALVQQAGIANYPTNFATDRSLSPPGMYVWPPPSGAFTVQIRYYALLPDIATPETSTTIPWFPDQTYLIRRLSGELMNISNDDRARVFISDAQEVLKRYLNLQADDEGRAMSVSLDRRRFGGNNLSRLPNTKTLGW